MNNFLPQKRRSLLSLLTCEGLFTHSLIHTHHHTSTHQHIHVGTQTHPHSVHAQTHTYVPTDRNTQTHSNTNISINTSTHAYNGSLADTDTNIRVYTDTETTHSYGQACACTHTLTSTQERSYPSTLCLSHPLHLGDSQAIFRGAPRKGHPGKGACRAQAAPDQHSVQESPQPLQMGRLAFELPLTG